MRQKIWAAGLSVASNIVLVIAKLGVGLAIGSVSVISEAIHSATDLVASIIALYSVNAASRPADADHRYGHGKIENLSALIEGLLVLLAAGYIIVETITRMRSGGHPEQVGWGLFVMGLSAGVNVVVSNYLYKVGRAEQSVTLIGDAVHLRSDVYTSVGVFVGLLLTRVTGLVWIDAVVGLVVAVMIIHAGWQLSWAALKPLIDSRLPEEEEREIVRLIESHSSAFVEFHDLRTRQGGAERHVDFHLVVHGQRSLEEVHQLCDAIEAAIEDRFPMSHVLIHPEPCGPDCDLCQGRRTGRRVLKPSARPRVGRGVHRQVAVKTM